MSGRTGSPAAKTKREPLFSRRPRNAGTRLRRSERSRGQRPLRDLRTWNDVDRTPSDIRSAVRPLATVARIEHFVPIERANAQSSARDANLVAERIDGNEISDDRRRTESKIRELWVKRPLFLAKLCAYYPRR
jgi:hypothetical protein